MTINELLEFIESKFLSNQFKTILINEVTEFIRNKRAKLSSINISGDGEINSLFTQNNLISLFRIYLDSLIYEWELEYILNYIEFNFEFENENLEDIIFSFSDPYLGFEITKYNINSAIKSLELKSNHPNLKNTTKGSALRANYKHL